MTGARTAPIGISRSLSSGLYRRPRNHTGSADLAWASARGLGTELCHYRRWGISPRPENVGPFRHGAVFTTVASILQPTNDRQTGAAAAKHFQTSTQLPLRLFVHTRRSGLFAQTPPAAPAQHKTIRKERHARILRTDTPSQDPLVVADPPRRPGHDQDERSEPSHVP